MRLQGRDSGKASMILDRQLSGYRATNGKQITDILDISIQK